MRSYDNVGGHYNRSCVIPEKGPFLRGFVDISEGDLSTFSLEICPHIGGRFVHKVLEDLPIKDKGVLDYNSLPST